MAKASASLKPSTSTADNIRAIAAFMVNLFTTGGLVRTSDTGQTEANALAAQGATNTSSGYQVWRFDDDLQATAPVFFKISWGAGGTQYSPSIWLTIGSGSNGSGTITGITSTWQLTSNSYSDTALPCYGSANSNGFSFALFATSATYTQMFTLERSKDVDMNDTGDGLFSCGYSYGGWRSTYIPFDGSTYRPVQSYPCVAIPQGTGSLASGNSVGVAPIMPMGTVGPLNPSMNLMLYQKNDLTVYNPIPVNVYGTDHVYIPIWDSSQTSYFGNWASHGYLLRYE